MRWSMTRGDRGPERAQYRHDGHRSRRRRWRRHGVLSVGTRILQTRKMRASPPTDEPIDLNKHRGVVTQKATDLRRELEARAPWRETAPARGHSREAPAWSLSG